MARAFYYCPKCNKDWEAMSTMTTRLGTGRPVHCHCGEVAWLKQITRIDIGALPVKSAARIVANELDWAEDTYHQNILMGAKALEGSPDWIYHTQWSSGTTLWYNVDRKTEARVMWDDQKGWIAEIR